MLTQLSNTHLHLECQALGMPLLLNAFCQGPTRVSSSCRCYLPCDCGCLCSLQDCFEGVLGADFMGENAKPDAAAFHKVHLHHITSLFVLV